MTVELNIMGRFISFGGYRIKYAGLALFVLFVINILTNCRPVPRFEKKNSNHTFDMEEWDSLQYTIYDSPSTFLISPNKYIKKINTYIIPEELSEEYAWTLIRMAYLLFTNKGMVQKAAELYEEALNFIKENDSIISNEDISTYIFKPLGNCYTMMGDYEKSQRLILHAIENTADINSRSSLWNNLGISYLYSDKLNKAVSAVRTAVESHRFQNHELEYALSCNILSEAYYKMRNIDSASYFNTKALEVFKNNTVGNDTLVWKASSHEMASKIHLLSGDTSSAIRQTLYGIQLLEEHFPNSRNREKSKFYNSLASLSSHHQAVGYYDKVMELLSHDQTERYIPDYTFTNALFGKAKTYEESNIDSAIHYYIYAVENDFRTQQLISSSESHLYNNSWSKNIVDRALKILYSKYPESLPEEQSTLATTALWLTELSKGRQLINEIHRSKYWMSHDNSDFSNTLEKIQFLYREKTLANDEYNDELNNEINKLLLNIDLKEGYFKNVFKMPERESFLKKLNSNKSYFLSAFAHEDSTYSFIRYQEDNADFVKVHEKSLSYTLHKFKSTYFKESPKEYNNDPEKYRREAEDIKNILFKDLPKKKKTKIFVSPDGELHGLPIDALWLGDRYIAESYDLAYLNSLLLLEILKPHKNNHNISILHRSVYPPPLPNLPFVEKEVESIHLRYNNTLYGPEEQNLKNINRIFDKGDIIHIAAHTTLEEGLPPTLQLHESISTDALSFFTIRSPMIFLAACNTSQGEILSSEGIASLNRSFLSKGVPSVLSTYWFANDEIMRDQTMSFYNKLLMNSDPIRALADSKRDFLSKANAQMHNPWYWANINYHGIENSVKIEAKIDMNYVFLFLIISIILFIIVYYPFIKAALLNLIKA